LFVFRGPDGVFGVVFGLVLALGLVWVVVSVLHPSHADRRCPRCGRGALERADRDSLAGVRCRSCSWRDDTASAFLLAEDEGEPFEDVVLRERTSRRRYRRW
jgi:ribosomal protein L37AE/L43A